MLNVEKEIIKKKGRLQGPKIIIKKKIPTFLWNAK